MQARISRRSFLHQTSLLAGIASLSPVDIRAAADRSLPDASPRALPRWRGFNLLEKFNGRNDPFRESDFAWLADLGFNFVRLPMDYRTWIEENDWTRLREATLKEIDATVKLGERFAIHVQINFHRAPGYTVARPPEPKPVWTDAEALQVCTRHWTEFARRYQGIPSRQLSFNLFNEPAGVSAEVHRRVIAHLTGAIHAIDRDRLVICDGREWGNEPPTELLNLGVAAATRGYRPMGITHYQASWVNGADRWPVPTHPLKDGAFLWDKAGLKARCIDPWEQLRSRGMGIMVGEFGVHNRTPHDVALAFLADCLALWKEAGWGWAMWNFRGSFGPVDSQRADVAYESVRGHQVDRKMLALLQAN